MVDFSDLIPPTIAGTPQGQTPVDNGNLSFDDLIPQVRGGQTAPSLPHTAGVAVSGLVKGGVLPLTGAVDILNNAATQGGQLVHDAGAGLVHAAMHPKQTLGEAQQAVDWIKSHSLLDVANNTHPIDWTVDLVKALMHKMPLSSAVSSVGVLPASRGEQYVESLAEAPGNAFYMGPGAFAKKLLVTAAANGSGQLANQVTDTTPDQATAHGNILAQIAASILAGGSAAIASGGLKNTAELSKLAVGDIPQFDLETAQQGMVNSKAAGLDTTLAQQLPAAKSKALQDLTDTLAANGLSKKLTSVYAGQPAQVMAAGEGFQNSLPGIVDTPGNVANDVGQAATQSIIAAKKAQTDAFTNTTKTGLQEQQQTAADNLSNANDTVTQALLDAQAAKRAVTVPPAVMGKAGMETLTQPMIKVGDQLGNYGQLANARRINRGQQQLDYATPSELTDAGVPQSKVDEVVAQNSPVTESTGAIVNPNPHALLPEEVAAQEARQAQAQAQTAFQNVGKIPDETIQAIGQHLDERIAQGGGGQNGTVLAKNLQELKNKLIDPETGNPLTNDALTINDQMNSFKNEKVDMPNLSTPQMSKGASAQLKMEIGNVHAAVGDAIPSYTIARQKMAEGYDAIKAMERGIPGKLAGIRGTFDDDISSPAKLKSIIRAGSNPNLGTTSAITEAANTVNSQNPEIWQNAVKSELSDNLQKLKGNKADLPPDIGSRFGAYFGAPGTNAYHGWLDQMQGVAEGLGLKGDDADNLVKGFTDLVDHVAIPASRVPKTVSAAPAQMTDEIAGQNKAGTILKARLDSPGWPLGRMLEHFVNGKSYKDLGDMLSDPDRIQELIQLGKTPTMSKKWQVLVGTTLSNFEQSQSNDKTDTNK